MKFFLRLLGIVCRHRHTSKPFSANTPATKNELWDPVPSSGAAPYVVCFDCGRHLDYDWSSMRIVER